ncbi:MAG: NUDIX domain-containing protein [Meiothermus sp.]|nr:NUDIX domain-containing protein [Meiothermus sp.]
MRETPPDRPTLHLLARAVIFVEGQVLLARAGGARHTFLPGGHLEAGESLPVTLERQLLEETGQRCVVQGYLGAVEHALEEGGRRHFEVNHLFVAALPDLDDPHDLHSADQHLQFIFAAPDALELLRLEPRPVIGWIQKLARGETPPTWASSLEAR